MSTFWAGALSKLTQWPHRRLKNFFPHPVPPSVLVGTANSMIWNLHVVGYHGTISWDGFRMSVPS